MAFTATGIDLATLNAFAPHPRSTSLQGQVGPVGDSLGSSYGFYTDSNAGDVVTTEIPGNAGEHGIPCTMQACDDLLKDIQDHEEEYEWAMSQYENCMAQVSTLDDPTAGAECSAYIEQAQYALADMIDAQNVWDIYCPGVFSGNPHADCKPPLLG